MILNITHLQQQECAFIPVCVNSARYNEEWTIIENWKQEENMQKQKLLDSLHSDICQASNKNKVTVPLRAVIAPDITCCFVEFLNKLECLLQSHSISKIVFKITQFTQHAFICLQVQIEFYLCFLWRQSPTNQILSIHCLLVSALEIPLKCVKHNWDQWMPSSNILLWRF